VEPISDADLEVWRYVAASKGPVHIPRRDLIALIARIDAEAAGAAAMRAELEACRRAEIDDLELRADDPDYTPAVVRAIKERIADLDALLDGTAGKALLERLARSERQRGELLEALAFYANKESWEGTNCTTLSGIVCDFGSRARAAIVDAKEKS
jgi:hypothetical protein